MGIKYLNKFLVKKCGASIFKKLPVSMLRGIRIAIDADNFLHIQWSNAMSTVVDGVDLLEIMDVNIDKVYSVFISKILIYIRMLCNMDITPMFVFDGKGKPKLKKDTQNKRREQILKGRESYIEYRDSLLNNPLDVSAESIKILRSKYKQGKSMLPEHRRDSIKFIKNLGIPYAQAVGEAEQLASRLCHESKVDAVLSQDTDCLCFGAPVVINQLGGRGSNKMATTIYLDNVLESLKLNYTEYIDLCIMAGTDYNDNIPQLAIARSYDALVLCRSIENLSISKKFKDKDTSCYLHEEVRDIFKIGLSDLCIEDIELNGTGEIGQHALDICLKYDLIDHIPQIKTFLHRRMFYKENHKNIMMNYVNYKEPTDNTINSEQTEISDIKPVKIIQEQPIVQNNEATLLNDGLIHSSFRLKRQNYKIPKN